MSQQDEQEVPSEEQLEGLKRAFRRPIVGTLLGIIARTEMAMQAPEEEVPEADAELYQQNYSKYLKQYSGQEAPEIEEEEELLIPAAEV